MDALSDYGASRSLSLNDAAHLVGLPGKTDMDGSKVADVVARGEDQVAQDRVARYCAHDVLQTALVFLRSRVLFGYLTLDGLRASVESFKEIAQELSLEVDWNAYLML
jgi:predicted PolB exonuclease-like 3'-5' exonuclease